MKVVFTAVRAVQTAHYVWYAAEELFMDQSLGVAQLGLARQLREKRVDSGDESFLFSDSRVDYKALLDSSMDVIFQVALRKGEVNFIYLSPSVYDVFGWRSNKLHEHSPQVLFTEEARHLIGEDVRSILSGDRDVSTIEVQGVHKSGKRIWLENKVKVLSREGETVQVVIAMRDISRRIELEKELARLASMDGLTGLANRRTFDERLRAEWLLAAQSSQPLSLIMAYVDHFKQINDSFGHQTGDDCLKAVTAVIERLMPDAKALVARFGGEEIAIILPGTNAAMARKLADDICHGVKQLRIPSGTPDRSAGFITVSCGVSTALSRSGGSVVMPEGLLLAADRALYQAKADGRDCVRFSLLLTPISGEHQQLLRSSR